MLIRATQRSEEGELALIRTAQLFVGGLLCSEEGGQRLSGGGLRPKEPLLSSDGALLRPNQEELWLEEPARSSDGRLLCSEEPEQSPAGGRYCTQVN